MNLSRSRDDRFVAAEQFAIALRAAGEPYRVIAERLNGLGFRTARDKLWTTQRAYELLRTQTSSKPPESTPVVREVVRDVLRDMRALARRRLLERGTATLS